MRRPTRWTLVLIATAVGCSDSYLFSKKGPSVPALSPSPSSPMPLTPAPREPEPEVRFPEKGMIFVLNGSAELPESEILDILFPGQNLTPQNAGAKKNQWPVVLSLVSENMNEKLGERYVDATLTIEQDSGAATNAIRELVADDVITLKNTGTIDRMSGFLVPADKSLGEFQIEAQRVASDTEELARKNPWSGTLSIVRKGKTIRLGVLKGFAE